MVKLDAPLVHGIADLFLKSGFDAPKPTPEFHDLMWELCCSDETHVAIAAPRSHAKSTAITHCYLITNLIFRARSYVIIISDTEEQAVGFLGDIKREFLENEDLIQQFGVKRFIKEAETDVIVEFDDGEQFRILAKGSEQKIRGKKWRGKRPDLVVCHEKGTKIFADGKWMLNQDHPTAKEVNTSGYRVTFEDGTIETISKDHRYWVEGIGWVFSDELEINMEVGGCYLMTKEEQEIANITESGGLTILKKLNASRLRIVNDIKKRYLSDKENGLQITKSVTRNKRCGIILKIRIGMIRVLENMLKRVQNGKRRTALKDELKRKKRCLYGQMKNI
jgi:hypothetical protein